MSLVNDVLRQLETNSSQPYKGMPLQPLMATESVERNKWIHFSFLALIVFLLIIITLQVFYKNSAMFEVGGHDVVAPELTKIVAPELTRMDVPEITKIIAPVSKPPSMKNELPESLPITASIVLPKQRIEKTEDLASDLLQHKSLKHESVKHETVSKKPTSPVDNSLAEEANITSVKNAGFKHYQLALRAYKQKHSEAALTWVNLALSEEPKEEYLRLKVRILMQQGLGNEIYKLAIEQANNTNLSWFELIAPSLQMYSFYELSNKYYAELITQQPNETKWQLAMALNYSKLGKNDRTIAIYKNLLQSTLLTYRQKKWITSRLENMNTSEVAIYE